VTGKPPAPLSKRARKAKEKEDQEPPQKKGKHKATTPSNSSSDSDSHTLAHSTRVKPKPKQTQKSFSSDALDSTRVNSWVKLFSGINEALHIASMLVEHLNPDLAKQCYKLSETLKADTKKHGEFLSVNDCCLPGVAVHFNMQPEEGEFHTDRMSLFLGWESIFKFI